MSYQLIRRVSYADQASRTNHGTRMTPKKTTETFMPTIWYTNHHNERSSEWGPRPYSLAEIIYEYNTEDKGRCGCQRDSYDHFHENHEHPLHQYLIYLEDGGRRRYVHTDTGDEQFYAYLQLGLQLEEGNWSEEDYNYIRPGQSSIRDEAYRNWYEETTHPRPHSLNMVIEYWVNRRN